MNRSDFPHALSIFKCFLLKQDFDPSILLNAKPLHLGEFRFYRGMLTQQLLAGENYDGNHSALKDHFTLIVSTNNPQKTSTSFFLWHVDIERSEKAAGNLIRVQKIQKHIMVSQKKALRQWFARQRYVHNRWVALPRE